VRRQIWSILRFVATRVLPTTGRNSDDEIAEKQAEFDALDEKSSPIMGTNHMVQILAQKAKLLRETS
jgi:hypothetical protein